VLRATRRSARVKKETSWIKCQSFRGRAKEMVFKKKKKRGRRGHRHSQEKPTAYKYKNGCAPFNEGKKKTVRPFRTPIEKKRRDLLTMVFSTLGSRKKTQKEEGRKKKKTTTEEEDHALSFFGSKAGKEGEEASIPIDNHGLKVREELGGEGGKRKVDSMGVGPVPKRGKGESYKW